MAIDSGGHATHETYNYCRDRIRQGVVPIKGSSKRNSAALGKGSKVDVNWRGRTVKKGVTLYMLGTDTIKTTLFGRMRHKEGLGSINFGLAADHEYFQQLTSEKMRLRFHRGFPIREYVKKASARNEALDCFVYAYAAMLLYSRRLPKLTMWENLREKLESGDNKPLKSSNKPAKPVKSFVNTW
jgi:phage terminase large subunit GpA-like protein